MLEICYQVIAILSCRAGGPSTASYARRISASDRIQQLLSNGNHSNTTPIPLIPYAVGLSLTVAYRGLRDNHVDAERAQSDLSTRCETLESLSTYWWTADAMARLGRKALKSLQQPGVRKHSVVNIANAMDAEVAVCKFGPFEPKSRIGDAGPTSSVRRDVKASSSGSGNALHVLSDAAATHSTNPSIQPDSTAISLLTSPPTSLPTPIPSGTTRPSTGTINTINGHLHSSSASATASSLPTPQAPPPYAHHPGFAYSGDPFLDDEGYQFNDLDNLFDGFFDLSMPTIFQDPLFDGDAFMAGTDTGFADDGVHEGGMAGELGFTTGGHDVGMGNGGEGTNGAPSMAHLGRAGGGSGSVYPDLGLNG